jgi:hypothetical protein
MPAGQGQVGLGPDAPRPLHNRASIQPTTSKAHENQRRSDLIAELAEGAEGEQREKEEAR